MRRPLALLAATLLLAAACAREPAGPEATYRALTRAVAERDEDAAWSLLSRRTQDWLEDRAREASRAAPGVVAAGGRRLLLGDAALAVRAPSVIEKVSDDGSTAVLSVQSPGGAPARVTMVREGGGWRLDLPAPGWTGPAPSAR